MSQIQTLLQQITGRRTVPNILLDFTSIGGSDEITLIHSEGGLKKKFEQMGVLGGFGRHVNTGNDHRRPEKENKMVNNEPVMNKEALKMDNKEPARNKRPAAAQHEDEGHNNGQGRNGRRPIEVEEDEDDLNEIPRNRRVPPKGQDYYGDD
jgi:hypothetical protein